MRHSVARARRTPNTPRISEPGNVPNMTTSSKETASPRLQLIDAKIEELGDWRGETLSRLRGLIKQADPGCGRGVEVEKGDQSRGAGVVPPGWDLHRRDVQERREAHVLQGSLAGGPPGLFNSSLDGKVRRAIDFHEDDEIDEKAFVNLIRAAVSLNESSSR